MQKKICPRCQGNGFIKVKESIENPTEVVQQCTLCNSQGEIMIDEQRSKSIETERLTLESVLVKQLNGIIKKQNDEIDMLIKQKKFLQSKLRERKND
jgi:DnaJ-class molecular chaperone